MSKIKTHEQNTTIRTFDRSSNLPRHMKDDDIRTKAEVEKGEGVNGNLDISSSDNSQKNTKVQHHAAKHIKDRESSDGTGVNENAVPKGKIRNAMLIEKRKRGSKKKIGARISKMVGAKIKSTADNAIQQQLNSYDTNQATEQAQRLAIQSAIKAKQTADTTKTAVKTTVKTTKFAIRFSKKMVKGVIAATRSLTAALLAGGSVTVFLVIMITIIGLLFNSFFGIFFSGFKSPDKGSITMPEAIEKINAEYNDKIKKIENKNKHTSLEMSGTQASWKEVLAVYAVHTVNGKDGQSVATVNKFKLNMLRNIFWQMHSISKKVKTVNEEVKNVEHVDGKWVEKGTKIVTKKVLYIHVKHLTALGAAKKYGYTDEQKAQIKELLDEGYAREWEQVLYGLESPTGGGSKDLVAVAKKQVGNVGGRPYWSWYGFNSRVEWCACFVSWCANQCGYIKAGVIPKFAACHSQGVPWFKARNRWKPGGGSYKPKPGDIIFFDWQPNGHSDHVGIVEKYANGTVYTIEGNSNDVCKRKSYPVNSRLIHGYGVPAY